MNFMQKKIISFIISSALILSCLTPFRAFAAAEEILAAFEYGAPENAAAGDNLSDGDSTAGYNATSGSVKTSARLFASINGSGSSNLVWSNPEYKYGTSKTVQVPIMAADDNNAWGKSPYFEIKCSTLGYENIKFSAKVSGSKKGSANYKLQYSTDQKNYSDVITAATITKNKDLRNNLFDYVDLPGNADNRSAVYFRIVAVNTTPIEPANFTFENNTGGEAAINDVIIYVTSKSGEIPTLAAPAASIASGSEIYGNTRISLSCSTSQSSKIYYTVNDGAETEYSGEFMPFKNIPGITVKIKAWAVLDGDATSDTAVYTYTSTKDEITSFDFSDGKYPDYVNGAVTADSGIYPTGRITASLDGSTQYTPLYSIQEKAILNCSQVSRHKKAQFF